jgi:hypothetical protein
MSKFHSLVLIATVTMLIAGCSKGLDRTPDISSPEKYRAKALDDLKEVPKAQTDAYNWAVSDQTVDTLKSNYSGKSYRQIANAELVKEIAADTAAITALDMRKVTFEPIVTELRKIAATTSGATIAAGSFGDSTFNFTAHITNGGKLAYSSLQWEAQLFLDGAKEPAAKAQLYSVYERTGGLNAGGTSDEEMHPDVFFSKAWITLASQNAKERTVVLVLKDATDYSNHSYLDGAPYAELEKRKTALDTANKSMQALAL